jgi:hypothetical protein
MPRKRSSLQVKIDELTVALEQLRESAMRRAGYKAFGQKEIASFHGTIGGKNNEYVTRSVRYSSLPNSFWPSGSRAR